MRAAAAAPFAPAVAVLAVWVAWIPLDGGYFPRVWYPAGLFAVALVGAVALAARRLRTGDRTADVALVLLAGFTAWCFASIAWSDSPGAASEAAGQMLTYLAIAWLVAQVPWRPGPAWLFLGAWSIAVAVVCAIVLVSGLGASDLSDYFLESRWQQPTGYANTAAAIAAMAFWPALMLASRRGAPAALQAFLLAGAAFLVAFSLLPQSRSAQLVTIFVLPLVLALTPHRGRLLARLAVVALAVAPAVVPIYDVYDAGVEHRAVGPVLDDAAGRIALSAALAALGALALALAERRISPGPRAIRTARAAALGTLIAVAVAAGGAAIVNAGEGLDYVDERWAEFKSGEDTPDQRGFRLAQRRSDKRYEYWRVSLNTFRDAPLGGAGAGGFEREYTMQRRPVRTSRSPHSMWMRSLGETGIVGTALLAAFVALVAGGLLRAHRRLDADGRGIVIACTAVAAYFLGHASVDWLELMPALAAPAVALPFLAMRLGAHEDGGFAGPPPGERRLRARAGGLVAAVAVAAGFAALALPYLSLRHVDSALDRAGSDPAGADRDLDRAASLNPLSQAPHLTRAQLALRQRRYAEAERAFERALDVERAWYPHFQLALLGARAGRFAEAGREIRSARELNPPDPLLADIAELIARRVRIDPASVRREPVALGLDRTRTSR